jgi:hypothetical protein
MRDNLQLYQVRINENRTATTPYAELTGQGTLIARITADDAKLQNLSPRECAQKWRDNLRPIFWREALDNVM